MPLPLSKWPNNAIRELQLKFRRDWEMELRSWKEKKEIQGSVELGSLVLD